MATKKSKSTKETDLCASGKVQREKELIQLVRQKALTYLGLANVTSVGVGYKIKDGKQTDELAIQFTVHRKLSLESLVAQGLEALPQFFAADDGTLAPVDVIGRSYRPPRQIIKRLAPAQIETSELTPMQIRYSRCDPIMPGISISHVDVTAGTFGAVVYDVHNGEPFILSNWHILNGPTGIIGEQIVQPAAMDDGNLLSNVVGRLVRSHLGLAGDCAIASIIGRSLNPAIFERDVIPRRVGVASIGAEVVKSGRTTGITYGIVRRVGVIVKMDYGLGSEQQVGGFEIVPNVDKLPDNGRISLNGDSGSVWMVDTEGLDKDVVLGLHFAGENNPCPEEECALACDIHSVLEKLQVTLANPSLEAPLGVDGTRTAAALK